MEAHSDAVDWGTALQAGRLRVQFPVVTGIFNFHWHNPSGRTMALRSTQPLTETSTGNISWGGKSGQCIGLTTLPPSCVDCFKIWNLGASTFWNAQGLSRPVMRLFYILIYATVRWVLLCLFSCSNKSHEDGGIQLFPQKRNPCKNHTHSMIFGKTGSW
jgi:hypothetical protein